MKKGTGDIMERKERLNKLGIEAVKLLKEFREEACMLGENPIEEIYLNDTNDIVLINNINEVLEYSLSEVSYLIEDGVDGFNCCGKRFKEGIELALSEAKYEYGKLDKIEFSKYIGSIIYAQYRCQTIYDRLIQIELETRSL